MVKPVKQGLHIFGDSDRKWLLSPRFCQCAGEPLTLFLRNRFLHLAFDGGSLGDARIGAFFQLVGHLSEVAKGVKDVALARDSGQASA